MDTIQVLLQIAVKATYFAKNFHLDTRVSALIIGVDDL